VKDASGQIARERLGRVTAHETPAQTLNHSFSTFLLCNQRFIHYYTTA